MNMPAARHHFALTPASPAFSRVPLERERDRERERERERLVSSSLRVLFCDLLSRILGKQVFFCPILMER